MSGSPSLRLRSLPVIDITPWIRPESEHYRGRSGGRRSTAAAIHAACLTYGFFYLDISSHADQDEMAELNDLARQFFALPQEVKNQLALSNQDGARGYQQLGENVTNNKADNHEGLDFYAPVEKPDSSKLLQGENQWPFDGMVPGFRQKFERWIEKMRVLGMILMEAMSVGLGMTNEEWQELRSKVDHSFWVMRVIGYPPLPKDYDGLSCGAHKDYGCLTFLYADPTPNALQVLLSQEEILSDAATTPIPATSSTGLAPSAASSLMAQTKIMTDAIKSQGLDVADEGGTKKVAPNPETGERGVWINVNPIPGCIVCNIGEMWEIWTNGLYKSTLHRVVHQGLHYRVSIPFFFEPNFDAYVAPLPAALRLQKDSIQPAYAYTPHTPHVPFPHHHNAEPAEVLAQRLRELVSEKRKPGTKDENGGDSGRAGARVSLEVVSPRSPPLIEIPHRYTPISIDRRYQPVVYGDFLMKKVGSNFATETDTEDVFYRD